MPSSADLPVEDLRICLFGPLRVLGDGEEIPLKRHRLRTLLAVLALQPGRAASIDVIATSLWGDRQPANALHAVHVYVSRIRAIHPKLRSAVVTRDSSYRLDVPGDAIDLARFETLVALARDEPERADGITRDALSLWVGAPLLGLEYEEFTQPTLRSLERAREEAIILGARAALRHDSAREWVGLLERAVAANPHSGDLWDTLVLTYDELGDAARADDARWRRSSGEGPSPSGNGRSRVWATTALIGRDSELADLAEIVGHRHLVTIVGPPGVGKTTLAEHLAAGYPRSAWVARLADRPSVEEALSDALGAPALPGTPSPESLARYAGPNEGLLVIDDCDPAADAVAEFIRLSKIHAPNLSILATARRPLGVPGEHVYPLSGLTIDTDEGRGLSEAAMLLSVGADDGTADPSILNAIATRLDGLPLALEIIGAAMARSSATAILDRISDPVRLTRTRIRGVPERHASLEETFKQSVSLLSEHARLVLRRVGWFSGTFDDEDAVAMTPELTATEVGDAVDELRAHSLLSTAGSSHRLLWVVAAYARTLDPDAAVTDLSHHASRIAAVVAESAPMLRSSRAPEAHRRLAAMALDIETAIDHLIDHDPDGAARLAFDLGWHWHTRGNWGQALATAERIAAAADGTGSLALALWPEMVLRFDLRALDDALSTSRRLIELGESSGDGFSAATAWAMQAAIHSTTGDAAQGMEAAAHARRWADELGDPWVSGVTRFAEASLHLATGGEDRAAALCDRILATPDPDPVLWSAAAYVVASHARRTGDRQRGQMLIDRAVELLDEVGAPLFRPITHIEQAMAHRANGRPLAAARSLLPIVDDAIRLGDWMIAVPCLEGLALVAHDLGRTRASGVLHAAAGLRRDRAAWKVNPWDLPEAEALGSMLEAGLPSHDLEEAGHRGRALSDTELADLATSVIDL